jgi:hypothetical protein
MAQQDSRTIEAGNQSTVGGPPLLTAAQVGGYLGISPKRVYELPIPQVRVSDRRIRYLTEDVTSYVRRNRRGL